MSIQEILGKLKSLYTDADLFLGVVLILVALVSFGLGRASVGDSGSPLASPIAESSYTEVSSTTDAILGGYVASKTGTKYHLPWCAGAEKISETNKIWFATKEEAEAAGYTPADNCKGI